MKKNVCIYALLILLSGCITIAEPESEKVAVIWGDAQLVVDCIQKGTLIGSEGNWYDFWLISNRDLTQGALNQLRNQAFKVGANTIQLYSPTSFSTSVTFVATAYRCEG